MGRGAHIVGLISVLWTVGGGHILLAMSLLVSLGLCISDKLAQSFFIVDSVCPHSNFDDVLAASILHSSS